MSTVISTSETTSSTQRTAWVKIACELGSGFAAREAALDANDSFGFENHRELKENRVYSAPIPRELGGDGASIGELCAMLREFGRHCGGTALALSMHTHLVATMVAMYRQGAPVAPLLQRIASEQLVLVTSGASDWLDSSGIAERVDGGYRVTARKHFSSGAPVGDIYMTSAIYDDQQDGSTVLHFSIPMKSPGITIVDNWRTMAMRTSGSNDIELKDVFVPDGAVSSRRPKGSWFPALNIVARIANPVIWSVYLGIAEAARDLAIHAATKRRDDPNICYLVGEMENALVTGQMAVQEIIDISTDDQIPSSIETINALLIRKTIVVHALLEMVEKALETVGGSGIFRSTGLERLVRDMHAAQFHPLQTKRQHRLTGLLALGLDPLK